MNCKSEGFRTVSAIIIVIIIFTMWPGPQFSHLKNETAALAGVAQLVGASFPKPKGCGFDSRSGHISRLRVWSQSGCIQEATD